MRLVNSIEASLFENLRQRIIDPPRTVRFELQYDFE
jgi:hypothetical protein